MPAALVSIAEGDTLKQTVAAVAAVLASAGIDTAQTDARHLVQGILNIDAAALLRDPGRAVGSNATDLQHAVFRRLGREPVARILGHREFYGRRFNVTPDVLDPRADTETLIDLVLEILRAEDRLNAPVTLADIGSGSGAIIVTLLAELPNATGIAIDVSPVALAVTRGNAEALGVSDRLKTYEGRGLCGINDHFDVIVSNPPYIPSGDISALDLEVRGFDPLLALDGGVDGLQIYRELANDIRGFLRYCWICLEIGAGQHNDVERIFGDVGAVPRFRRLDLGGHIRAVALEIHC